MEPKGRPETSAKTLRKISEDRRSQIFIEVLNPSNGSRSVTCRTKGMQTDRQTDTTEIDFCDCVITPKWFIK